MLIELFNKISGFVKKGWQSVFSKTESVETKTLGTLYSEQRRAASETANLSATTPSNRSASIQTSISSPEASISSAIAPSTPKAAPESTEIKTLGALYSEQRKSASTSKATPVSAGLPSPVNIHAAITADTPLKNEALESSAPLIHLWDKDDPDHKILDQLIETGWKKIAICYGDGPAEKLIYVDEKDDTTLKALVNKGWTDIALRINVDEHGLSTPSSASRIESHFTTPVNPSVTLKRPYSAPAAFTTPSLFSPSPSSKEKMEDSETVNMVRHHFNADCRLVYSEYKGIIYPNEDLTPHKHNTKDASGEFDLYHDISKTPDTAVFKALLSAKKPAILEMPRLDHIYAHAQNLDLPTITHMLEDKNAKPDAFFTVTKSVKKPQRTLLPEFSSPNKDQITLSNVDIPSHDIYAISHQQPTVLATPNARKSPDDGFLRTPDTWNIRSFYDVPTPTPKKVAVVATPGQHNLLDFIDSPHISNADKTQQLHFLSPKSLRTSPLQERPINSLNSITEINEHPITAEPASMVTRPGSPIAQFISRIPVWIKGAVTRTAPPSPIKYAGSRIPRPVHKKEVAAPAARPAPNEPSVSTSILQREESMQREIKKHAEKPKPIKAQKENLTPEQIRVRREKSKQDHINKIKKAKETTNATSSFKSTTAQSSASTWLKPTASKSKIFR